VTNLESELRALAPLVDLPPERDLASTVRARIGTRRPLRRPLVVAVALLGLAVAIAFAVPPARSAILRWLGLGTARVEFVDRLPDTRRRRPLDLGEKTSLAAARRREAYDVLTSQLLGSPDDVRVRGDQVAFVYGRKLLVTQTRGMFFTKQVGPGSHVQAVRVNGRPGLWISGAPHVFGYITGAGQAAPVNFYLVGNVLIWRHDDLTLRLEGKLTRDEAIRIARSFR
jgi:hypothetical protein